MSKSPTKDPVCGAYCYVRRGNEVWCPKCRLWFLPGTRVLDSFGIRV